MNTINLISSVINTFIHQMTYHEQMESFSSYFSVQQNHYIEHWRNHLSLINYEFTTQDPNITFRVFYPTRLDYEIIYNFR